MAAAKIIAGEAVEDYQRAILRSSQAARNFIDWDRLRRERKKISRTRGWLLPSAHRRQKRDFIIGGEVRAKIRIFLIDRSGDAGAEFEQAGKAADVALVEIFDAGAVGEVGIVFGEAGDFAELAEEEDADAHEFIVA